VYKQNTNQYETEHNHFHGCIKRQSRAMARAFTTTHSHVYQQNDSSNNEQTTRVILLGQTGGGMYYYLIYFYLKNDS
jgi:hypothetical protein